MRLVRLSECGSVVWFDGVTGAGCNGGCDALASCCCDGEAGRCACACAWVTALVGAGAAAGVGGAAGLGACAADGTFDDAEGIAATSGCGSRELAMSGEGAVAAVGGGSCAAVMSGGSAVCAGGVGLGAGTGDCSATADAGVTAIATPVPGSAPARNVAARRSQSVSGEAPEFAGAETSSVLVASRFPKRPS